MAQIYPDVKTINKLKIRPTPGEATLLNFLKNNLSDDFEIYFQPWINGDHPDIVILRKNGGVFIIEVKDWSFNNYTIEDKNTWKLKKNNTILKSPIDKVKSYKENLYNLHIDGLLDAKIQNKKLFSLIKIGIYFHKESHDNITSFIKNEGNYVNLYGYDSIKNINNNILNDYGNTSFFTEELYNEFKRFLQPTFHTIEQGKEINYTKKQQELSFSEENKQQKIKGVAGSGKTLILAKRSVNAHKRIKNKVLILTYNITLKNYIHDKISEVKENFEWGNFYIDNYHNFINSQTNNLNIKIKNLSEYENINIFETEKNNIEKYDSIFIDEIQDYKTEWINIIKKYFLSPAGEFVVFGDEKQNIYDRTLDSEHKPNTTIPGRWAELNESFRLGNKIAKLSSRFQKEYFSKKYDIDDIHIIEQSSLFSNEKIGYLKLTSKTSIGELTDIVFEIIKNKNIHPNDVCILSSKTGLLRSIDFNIRKREKTKTTFETQEVFDELQKEFKNLDFELKKVRKNKKFNFWMNPGTSKLSTIHSFKGWEISTLFLLIDSNESNDELIYTAITRCRLNLFIINIDNEKYNNFFLKNNDIVNILLRNQKIVNQNKEEISSETIEDIEKKELKTLIPVILNNIKGNNNKFKIAIIGEIAGNKNDFESKLGSFFNKYDISANKWDVEFIDNRKLKNTTVLKSFRVGQSSYSLLITGQIHQHSSSKNEEANLLKELEKPKYIKLIIGSSPKDKLTINNLIEKLDNYLCEQLKE